MARKAKPILTDDQWALIEPLLPKHEPSSKGGRRPIDNRRVLEGILWILRTGARWQDLPDRYPSPSTCWRRLRDWEEQDVWVEVWRTFLADLDKAGWLDWEEAFVDASFFPAKKGARASERRNVAREQSAWWWQTAKEFLWASGWHRPRRRR
jgi:transposase